MFRNEATYFLVAKWSKYKLQLKCENILKVNKYGRNESSFKII